MVNLSKVSFGYLMESLYIGFQYDFPHLYRSKKNKSNLKTSHLSLLYLSIHPPLKKKDARRRRSNSHVFSLKFRVLILNKVLIFLSWDSIPQEILLKMIPNNSIPRVFTPQKTWDLWLMMKNYDFLWLIKYVFIW